ncbi:hypothetical protein Tco_0548267 [Tanacetum coccineum]
MEESIIPKELVGFFLDFVDESEDEDQNDDDSKDGGSNVHEMGSCGGDSDVEEVPDTLFEKDGQYPPGFTPKEGTDAASMHMEVQKLTMVTLRNLRSLDSNATISDYFVMVRGVWRLTGQDLLMISVYAPHDFKDKQLLWDYLTREIVKWQEMW